MKNRGMGRERSPGVLWGILLSAILILAGTAGNAERTVLLPDDPDMILARNTVETLDIRNSDQQLMEVRSDPSVEGRGKAGPEGRKPYYVGMLGYAVLPQDPAFAQSGDSDSAYWVVPLYRTKQGSLFKQGSIPHKTPVLVIAQRLSADWRGGYRGYLLVIRLDLGEQCLMNVSCFESFPYWTLPMLEIPEYGYSMAVYRETPGEGPHDGEGMGCSLHDGTRVLIPYKGAVEDLNPDPDRLAVQGIVFEEDGEGEKKPHVLYFREDDLIPTY